MPISKKRRKEIKAAVISVLNNCDILNCLLISNTL